MCIRLVALCFLLAASSCLAQEPVFKAGTDYELVRAVQETSSPAGRVEVAEIFQYGCGGCAQFEPYLESWAANKPDHVDLVRIPAVWNPLGELHARAFYTAEALGVLDRTHAAFFRALHVDRNRLDSQDKLRELFAGFGVDGTAFDATFSSFAVHTKVQRAKELVTRYGIGETPSIVVDGKYLTRGGTARTYARWFDIIEELAVRRREPN